MKKQVRIGESIIESFIAVVASISIVLIFLIFLFVFREATGIFVSSTASDSHTEKSQSTSSASSSSQSGSESTAEVYNPDESDTQNKSESKSASNSSSDSQAEVYNPDSDETPSIATQIHSESTAQSSSSSDNSGADVYNPDSEENAPKPIVNEAQSMASPSVGNNSSDVPQSIWQNMFAGTIWQPVSEQPKFGLWPLIVGTAKATLISILIGAPLGILAAMYSAMFAKKWMREVVKPVIEILAGFPSVVVGFLCLMTIGSLVQNLFGTEFRLNALVGGIGLSFAIIPVVFTICDDAFTSVPKRFREASLALGATEWETAFKILLPAALPGVFAAVLLGIGRAFGETMIAIMATGNASMLTGSPFEPVRTFAATIGSEMGEVVWGSLHYNVLFFIGVLLFVFSFVLNVFLTFFVKERLMKKIQGS